MSRANAGPKGLVLSRAIYENITLPHLKQFSRGGVFLDRRRERRIAGERGTEVRLKAAQPTTALL